MLTFADGLHVVYTQKQTAGRGLGSNSWESEAGKNIAFSIVCHPRFVKPQEQFILSMAIAVDIVKQLREDFPKEAEHFRAKWPNDIYWKDGKMGGILIETSLKGQLFDTCILGIGLNINQQTFLSDAPNPVSLRNIVGEDCDAVGLMRRISERFCKTFLALADTPFDCIRQDYHRILYRFDNHFYTFCDANGVFKAKIVKVQNNGKLVLNTDTGEMREYWLKEVRSHLSQF